MDRVDRPRIHFARRVFWVLYRFRRFMPRAVRVHFRKIAGRNLKHNKSLGGISPAMAAGVTDKPWDMSDIVAVIEEAEPAPAKRGPYKTRG